MVFPPFVSMLRDRFVMHMANFRTLQAGFRTDPAVVHMRMFAALLRTHPADLLAKEQVLVCNTGFALKQHSGLIAQVCTVMIQPDAFSHFLYITFFQAFGKAHFTGECAIN